MVTKIINRFLDKKTSNLNQYDKNVLGIAIIFDLIEKQIISKRTIKQYLKHLNVSKKEPLKLKQYLTKIENTNDLKKIINAYHKLYTIASHLPTIKYNFKQIQSDQEIIKQNDQYMIFFKELGQLNNLIIKCFNFNYSILIEYIRNSLIGMTYAK